MRGGRGHSTSTSCRRAIAHAAELLGGVRRLPEHVRRQARESYRLFAEDPRHPSLQFKQVSQRRPVYSVRINIDYRAVGVRDGEELVWFWIGPHHEYNRLLKRV